MDQRTKQFYEQKLSKENLRLAQILRIQRGINEQRQKLLQLLKEVTENDGKPILEFYEVERREKQIEAAEIEATDHINELIMQCGEKMDDLQSGRFKVPENSQQTKRQASPNTHLKSNEEKAMTIFVRIRADKIRTFEVYPSDLVEDLKYIIERIENIPSEHQILTSRSRRLENHHTLGEYYIRDGEWLYVRISARGY
jgi:hypothetical protein